MRVIYILIAVLGLAAPAWAQQPEPSSSDAVRSVSEDAPALPVSLDHIRAALAKPAPTLLLRVDIPADFKSEVRVQQKLDELVNSLDFKSGPVPPGGLYGYEQQRQVFNPTDHPLMQPYAAFNGGELLTLAIEGLVRRYLGERIVNGITDSERARAEATARAEVLRSIADYCAVQPYAGDVSICKTLNPPSTR